MTKEEAFSKMELRYYGPNIKARILKIMEDYAREKCEEMREMCADKIECEFDDIEDDAEAFNLLSSMELPEFN